MLVHLRSPEFKKEFLDYVNQDPVHGLGTGRSIERRCRYDRNIFFEIENGIPIAVLCVAYTKKLPDVIDEILSDASNIVLEATHAIFYSVFRTSQPCEQKNVGAKLIREAAEFIRETSSKITNFVTMSPVPNLSAHFKEPPTMESIIEFLKAQTDPVAKFHLDNGARVLRTIPNADTSEKRQKQSYGVMVNYDYTPIILNK